MTLSDAMEAVARSLRQFGYPETTAAMIREAYDAWAAGETVPHGIIGMMATGQFEENRDALAALPR